MKRRFESKTGCPLTKTTADIARNRGFHKPSEIKKAKRVRFDDAETDTSFRGQEAIQSPKCGGPKTSEYAYFRKMKDGAVNGHSRALHKDSEQLKSSKTSYLLRETNKASEKLDPGIKDLNFSISGESAGTSGQKLFISPPVSRYDELHEIRKKELTNQSKQRSPLLTETATPVGQRLFSSLQNQTTEKSENQCTEEGLFSEKRKRLRQWVAQTTSTEVGKIHEKGSDLVSFLLCRLIPKGKQNNDSLKENADNSSRSLTIHQSDNVEEGLSLSYKRDRHKELPKISSEKSSEIVHRERDSFESGFPSNYHEDGELRKNTDHTGRSSEIVHREWDRFDSGFPSNYHKDSELRKNTDHTGRSSEIVLREWDSFDCGFPSNYHKDGELRKDTDHTGRSSEIVLREWDSFDSRFPSNYHKDGELRKNMDHSGRSSEIVLGEWDNFNSRFPSNYHKDGELRENMDHSGRSSEIVLGEWNNFHSRYPSNYHRKSDLRNKTMLPDQHSSSRIYNISNTQHGFSFCLPPFESLRSSGAFYFKDLDEFGPTVEHEREESHRNSLEWEFESGKDRADHGTRQDLCHRPANAWNFDQQGVVDNMLDTDRFCPSPLFPRRCLFKPLPNYVSTGCLMDVDQPESDDVKYTATEPRQFSLSFPCSPKRIPSAEDRYPENDVSNSDVILPHRDPRQPNKVWDCTPYNDFWWKCLPAPTENHQLGFHAWQSPQNEKGLCSLALLKESPQESFGSYNEGAFDHYLLPSTLDSPVDTYMNCPLLLNHVSHDIILDQELYCDDYDNQMGYRKML